ncbi:MAG: hypothetical protein ACJZ1Q_02730 [Candidatus Neomarinimicrobiota bacterium]|tara:strand:+ start:244 stop:552 length:309 start_codon:yes stop_codon:yes gene_type:complete
MSKKEIRNQIFKLMDDVQNHLKKDSSIDNFLDNNTVFEKWEKVISKNEYPIFLIAVLNNIRSNTVMNSIISSIRVQKKDKREKSNIKATKKYRESFGEHPFN